MAAVAGDGAFNAAFAIPNIPAGPHTLFACRDISPGGECREQASASFRVVAPPRRPRHPPRHRSSSCRRPRRRRRPPPPPLVGPAADDRGASADDPASHRLVGPAHEPRPDVQPQPRRCGDLWQVDDPDVGALGETTFTVLWSADGETWIPAAVDVTGNEITIPTSARFPGGDDVQAQVIANDGVRTGTAASEAFSAPTHGPLVAIGGAPEGSPNRPSTGRDSSHPTIRAGFFPRGDKIPAQIPGRSRSSG